MFREERRFDVVGNPTSVRWGHLGGVGEVYRYDGSHRLVEVYEGLGVQGSGIDTFANPAQAVNVAFKLVREYNFDTKSNRTSVTMTDDNTDPISTDSYSPDADTNVYNQVNSQSYQFDAVENQTFDPTTGLYKRYDYLNRLIAEYGSSQDMENDAALKRYRYDVHNRMRVEETNYPVEDTETNAFTAFYECFANCPGGSGGCGGNPGLIYASELRVNEADEPMRSVEYTIGVGITGSGSDDSANPWVATRLPGGPNNNKSVVLVEVAHDEGGSFFNPPPGVWRFRHENQQRSLIGMTDLDGLPTAEVDYNEYGLAYLKDVLWVPGAGSLAEATDDEVEPWGGVAVLEVDVGLVEADLVGAMARVVHPTTAPHVVTGRIVAHVAGTPDVVYIEDSNGDFLSAINAGGIVTVFAHYDATLNGSQLHTSGRWTTAPAHVSGTTTFTASGSVFEDYVVGWQIQPDARYPVFFEITGVDGAEITVRGDLESQIPNLESEAVHYILIPPVGIDRTTGAIDTSFAAPATRYLAFGYHYIAPVVGVSIDDTTYGRQQGTNLAGNHYCWHRFYRADTGHWISPDSYFGTWRNAHSYCGGSPLVAIDPNGFSIFSELVKDAKDWVKNAANNVWDWLAGALGMGGPSWHGSAGQWLRLDYVQSSPQLTHTCGEFSNYAIWLVWGFVWMPMDLWVVQEMHVRWDQYDCVTDAVQSSSDARYLEAWPFFHTPPFYAPKSKTAGVDTWWRTGPSGSKGYGRFSWAGRAVAAHTTSPRGWSQHAVPLANGLHATTSVNKWNNVLAQDVRSNVVSRKFEEKWNCCPPPNHTKVAPNYGPSFVNATTPPVGYDSSSGQLQQGTTPPPMPTPTPPSESEYIPPSVP